MSLAHGRVLATRTAHRQRITPRDVPSSPSVGRVPGVRLHAGECAFGASPMVAEAILGELGQVHHYPDEQSSALVDAIAAEHGVRPDQVTLGNGGDEMILLIVLALSSDSTPGVVTRQTFQSYEHAFATTGRPVRRLRLDGYRLPVPAIVGELERGAFAFVCNPHNPTGQTLRADELTSMVEAARRGDGVLVVDEAYAEYASDDFTTSVDAVRDDENVCVLRTFSKAYGLAGLRIGYTLSGRTLGGRLASLRAPIPYSVNRLAQCAAVAALGDRGHLRRTVARTAATRDWFRSELARRDLHCPRSDGNFVLVPLGRRCEDVRRALDRAGFSTRDTTSLGLPGHLRITIGTEEQMAGLLDALTSSLAGGAPSVCHRASLRQETS